ncbi:toxin-antitoxin system YwqK family antitoxin [Winogradskyella ouciana]|uniref:toxin-antitoxin system YwqK family antitoxin n=1 Tax=Winogradskyella ouciana TaxID=2608631 RepID=UPI003D26ECAE
MKKQLIFLLCLCTIQTAIGQLRELKQADIKYVEGIYYLAENNALADGILKDWYENGQLGLECTIENGELNGSYKKWYDNGQLYYDSIYKNNKPDQLERVWYTDGQLSKSTNYKNGIKHGESKTWFPNGQMRGKVNYNQGKFEGEYKVWYEDGQLRYDSFYKNDKMHGHFKSYTASGYLVIDAMYDNGKATFEKAYMPGGKDAFKSSFTEKTFKDGEMVSKKVFYDYKLYSETRYVNGEQTSYKTFD